MNFESIYLPPQGKYKSNRTHNGTSYGHPWQHNPLVHKSIQEPLYCRNSYVMRHYDSKKPIYTRNQQQVANGTCTYYLYDQLNRIIETGEVALPETVSGKNWCQYKTLDCDKQTAFIRSLPRTNVMVAGYSQFRNPSRIFYPLLHIYCYPQVQGGTVLTNDGQYNTAENALHYSFTRHSPEDVDVIITTVQAASLTEEENDTATNPVMVETLPPPQPIPNSNSYPQQVKNQQWHASYSAVIHIPFTRNYSRAISQRYSKATLCYTYQAYRQNTTAPASCLSWQAYDPPGTAITVHQFASLRVGTNHPPNPPPLDMQSFAQPQAAHPP